MTEIAETFHAVLMLDPSLMFERHIESSVVIGVWDVIWRKVVCLFSSGMPKISKPASWSYMPMRCPWLQPSSSMYSACLNPSEQTYSFCNMKKLER